MSTTIAVTGTASHQHPAERGTVTITVRFEAATREDALATATDLHARLTAEAAAFTASGAAAAWKAEQVWARTAEKFDNSDQPSHERQIVRYAEASATISVTFVDFASLGEWLGAVAEREGTFVEGIDWTLSDETLVALKRALRTRAVADARDRAEAYAAAADLRLGDIVAIYEPGLRPAAGSPGIGGPVFARSVAMSAGGSSFELKPGEIDVEAAITADFLAH